MVRELTKSSEFLQNWCLTRTQDISIFLLQYTCTNCHISWDQKQLISCFPFRYFQNDPKICCRLPNTKFFEELGVVWSFSYVLFIAETNILWVQKG